MSAHTTEPTIDSDRLEEYAPAMYVALCLILDKWTAGQYGGPECACMKFAATVVRHVDPDMRFVCVPITRVLA